MFFPLDKTPKLKNRMEIIESAMWIPLFFQRLQFANSPFFIPVHLLQGLVSVGIVDVGVERTSGCVASMEEGTKSMAVEKGDAIRRG